MLSYVIAGKGHECGQIIGSETVPFSEVEVVRSFLGTRA
jgi:UDP-N-acetylmuramyl tripeptide synthase